MDDSIIRNAGFPDASREDWMALVSRALKGADPASALRSATVDGIEIDPIYARRADCTPLSRQENQAGWAILQRLDDPLADRANRQAAEDMAGGAHGLSLVFEGAPNAFGYGIPCDREALETILADIPLAGAHLRVDTHPASRMSVEWLVEVLSARRVDPTRMTLSFGIDPAALFAGTGRLRMSIEALEASMPQSLAHFFAFGLSGVLLEADGRVAHNAGASEAQELAFVMASAAGHMRMFEKARQPLVYSMAHIGFALSADQDQFLTMAKLRALRLLWARMQEACGVEAGPTRIHAETSWRMLADRDPETNILRNTIAVFAAAVGGADSISVLPHTLAHGLPEPHARRLARNTQLILSGESNVGFVSDPGAGSGTVEALTDALCERAWDEFRTIESEGGLLRSLEGGRFQERVGAMRRARAEALSSGRIAVVGTTLYPLEKERHVPILDAERMPVPDDGAIRCEPLLAERLTETDPAAR